MPDTTLIIFETPLVHLTGIERLALMSEWARVNDALAPIDRDTANDNAEYRQRAYA